MLTKVKTEQPDLQAATNMTENSIARSHTHSPTEPPINLSDPRRRNTPQAPPPPRINIADRILEFESLSNPRYLKSGSATYPRQTDPRVPAPVPLAPAIFNQKEKPASLPSPATSSSTLTSKDIPQEDKNKKTSPQLSNSRSSSPYSPIDEEQDNKSKNSRTPKDADVLQSVSFLLKSKDKSLSKSKKNFYDLRRHYENKKVELGVVQDFVKELRKKVEVLTQEKNVMSATFDKENKLLQEQVTALQLEVKKLQDEKEEAIVRALKATSGLDYARVALEGQKIVTTMEMGKLDACKKENSELIEKTKAQQAAIEKLSKRVEYLETAIKDDVQDKNSVVAAFNLYIAKTQRRVEEAFSTGGDVKTEVEGRNEASSQFEAIPSQNGVQQRKLETSGVWRPPQPNGLNDTQAVPPRTPVSFTIKKERLSPDIGKKEGDGGDCHKRKVTGNEEDDSSSDSVVFISSSDSTDSDCTEPSIFKKQRCE